MCGIIGILGFDGQPIDTDLLIRGRDTLMHRGPDDAGLYFDPKRQVGLAHRRLSIIDLSAVARQPMANEIGTIWLVFNGEIYNYRELIPQLENYGHVFRSRSDSEVIIHAYEQWGIDCLSRFVGMFAFGIWDETQQLLFLARDHVGIKPLYYYYDDKSFVFASEIKAILKISSEARKPNYKTIYDFITITRFDHNEETFFEAVMQLRPGHYLTIKLGENNLPRQKKYWHCSPQKSSQLYDYSHPVDIFREYLTKSIELQLRSDVPVGAFLSGGLDSSSIVAIASSKLNEPLHVFSVIYNEKDYNESKWIADVTHAFDVKKETVIPSKDKMIHDMEKFVWFQENPTNGPGPFSEWCVTELAASSVKVVLSGQGADEMLGGYHYFYEPYFKTRLREILSKKSVGFLALSKELSQVSQMTHVPIWYYLSYMLMPCPEQIIQLGKKIVRNNMLSKEFDVAVSDDIIKVRNMPPGSTFLDRRLADSILNWGLSRLLHYLDRSSMAFSLEARVPFLDHRLIEYCMGLPYYWKMNGISTKHVLRESMKNVLPTSVAQRRDKKGFETPIDSWIKQSEDWIRAILSNDNIINRRIFDSDKIKDLLNNFFSKVHHKRGIGKRTYSWEIWRMVQLEIWFRRFIDDQQ